MKHLDFVIGGGRPATTPVNNLIQLERELRRFKAIFKQAMAGHG